MDPIICYTWNVLRSPYCDAGKGDHPWAMSQKRFPLILGRLRGFVKEGAAVITLQEVCHWQLEEIKAVLCDYHVNSREYNQSNRTHEGHADHLVVALHKSLCTSTVYTGPLKSSLPNVLVVHVGRLTVITTHLPMKFEDRERHCREMAEYVSTVDKERVFVITGDMNPIPRDDDGKTGIEPLKEAKRLIDATHPLPAEVPEWEGMTFRGYPWDRYPGPCKLDHIFVSHKHFDNNGCRNMATRTITDPASGEQWHESDHHPIRLSLSLHGSLERQELASDAAALD